MLTKVGKEIQKFLMFNQSGIPGVSLSAYSSTPALIAAKTTSNENLYIPPAANSTSTSIMTNYNNSSYGIAVGSSDTAATENDYILGNLITTLRQSAMPQVALVYDAENTKLIARIDLTLVNDTAEDIIVREIGRFACYNTTDTKGAMPSNATTNKRCVLVERTVLESPVTVPAQGTATIRYDFIYG